MISFFITLPFLVLAWIVYTSRNAFLCVSRWMLRRRYDITLTGTDCLVPERTSLIIPNHPAIVDPFLVVTELHAKRIDIRPLVDESFFSTGFTRHILALVDAVRVPDFGRQNFRPILKVRPTLRNSAKRAQTLGYTVLATLTSGRNVLLYPSGHITPDGRETIGNRQLAFNVISTLPEDVRTIAVRTRGLYGSMWSRVGGRQSPPFIRTFVKSCCMWLVAGFRRRRKVSIHFEDITDRCLSWTSGGRLEFNSNLERWYDSDLAERGLSAEPVST